MIAAFVAIDGARVTTIPALRRLNLPSPLTVSLGALLCAPSLFAQPNADEIARRELIADAEMARDAGDHPRAVDLAARAWALRTTPSLALLLAQEHAALGHIVEAISFAEQCSRAVDADPTLHHRARLQSACGALSSSLPARLARLTVRAPTTRPPGLRITVQHNELREVLWDVAYPINPGAVVVEAQASDGSHFELSSTLVEGESRSIEVVLRGATPTALRSRPDATPPPREEPVPSIPWRERLPGRGPYILFGAGVATLGIAGLFFGLRQLSVSARDDSAAMVLTACNADPTQCNYTDAVDADSRARTFNLLTNAAVGIGVVTLASGVAWWLVSFLRYRPAPRPPVTVGVWPTGGGAALSLGGAL